MSLDSYLDPQLAAWAALVRAAVRDDLDDGVLVSVYEDPRDLTDLNNMRLPAIAIYRKSEKRVHLHSHEYAHRVTVRFDYVASDVSEDKRPVRWPVLAKAWRSIADASTLGKHAVINGGNEILKATGIRVLPDTIKAVFGFAERGGRSFPSLRGEIDADFWPDDVDLTALDDFLTHNTSFAKPGDTDHSVIGDPADADYLADDTTTLPALGS